MLSYIYVYCDLVEYSFVGDAVVLCLKSYPLVPENDRVTILRCETPHYFLLTQNRFSRVSIEIDNNIGEQIMFGNELSLVKLHFRRA